MAFGFPAYHEESYNCPRQDVDLREAVKKTWQDLRWGINQEGENFLKTSTPMNMMSWGEKFEVTFKSGQEMQIRSECVLPTMCLDLGRNKHNVNKFLKALEETVNQTPPGGEIPPSVQI